MRKMLELGVDQVNLGFIIVDEIREWEDNSFLAAAVDVESGVKFSEALRVHLDGKVGQAGKSVFIQI